MVSKILAWGVKLPQWVLLGLNKKTYYICELNLILHSLLWITVNDLDVDQS